MFCYCYLHNAVQPLTAGLLLFFFNIMPAFLQSYIDLFLLTPFLLKAHSLQYSLVNFKPQRVKCDFKTAHLKNR